MNPPVNSLLVCGAGTMGTGIAQAAAASGIHTTLYDLNQQVLSNSRDSVEKNLEKLVSRGKITAEAKQSLLDNMNWIDDIQEGLADFVIEAILEKKEAKIALFNQLAEINHGETVFATNTSSLSVTAIAEGVKNPERVTGMHFFNPATIMKLVEVVKTKFTTQAALSQTIELAKWMGKTPVTCTDSPGFIVNRVARPFYIESLRLAEEGAGFAELDSTLESIGFKMGPFRLMDLIGNDVNYAVSCSVYEQLGKPERLKPSAIQQKKVEEGNLGKKSGRGYYDYSGE